jgi:hypothetical protein
MNDSTLSIKRRWRRRIPAVIFVVGLLVLGLLPCEARLGESITELKRRYGRPLEVEGTKKASTDHYSFEWESWVVKVIVQDGRSVSEEFTRRDRREFTLQEVRLLLADSTDFGLAWTPVNANTWRQRDRVATWTEKTLLVQDRALGD